ncbi:hypothetical protein [Zooshikella sp. RANM57]|uniref:hypothetical protein n=1 Tax=Zooshikella sp. RANM57 TaxID=3425863 RepID=UPI003D6FDE51
MNVNSVESLFRIVRHINNRERFRRNSQEKIEQNRHVNRLFLFMVIIPFSIAILITIVRRSFNLDDWLIIPALAMLAISYLGLFIHPCLEVFIRRRSLCRVIKNPMNIILDNAKSCADVDVKLLRYLRAKPIEHLNFLKIEINEEKLGIQKRVSLLVGAVEKMGLLPGILAMLVTISRLGEDQPEWVYAIAYATPLLHIFCVLVHQLISRLDRISSLIEHVVEVKEKSLVSITKPACK